MSKKNLRNAATLVRAIAVLDEIRWTWLLRWAVKRITKQIIAKGVN